MDLVRRPPREPRPTLRAGSSSEPTAWSVGPRFVFDPDPIPVAGKKASPRP